jgi:hypothetical protein
MKKITLYYILLLLVLTNTCFSQIFSGKINNNNQALENVSIDIFDYSQNIINKTSDKTGLFDIRLENNKEYIICFSKVGYISYVLSINIIGDYNKNISLNKDNNIPNGMLSSIVSDRVFYTSIEKKNSTQLFDFAKINSLKKADSIKVIFNKIQVYQYRYISNYNFEQEKNEINNLDYTQIPIEKNKIYTELSKIEVEKTKSISIQNQLKTIENTNIEESKTKQGNAQVKRLVNAQEALYKRVYEVAQEYLSDKTKNILMYKLKLLEYNALQKEENNAKDYNTVLYYKKNKLNTLSSAYNFLYRANNSYTKYENYISLYQRSYQEYIELLKYYKGLDDSIQIQTLISSTKNIEPITNLPIINKADTLSNMEDNERQILIEKALLEEERFKNYSINESTKKEDGEDVNITTIKIDIDTYEMISNKRGIVKYFKNTKPISATTYKFETTRKYKDILNSINR